LGKGTFLQSRQTARKKGKRKSITRIKKPGAQLGHKKKAKNILPDMWGKGPEMFVKKETKGRCVGRGRKSSGGLGPRKNGPRSNREITQRSRLQRSWP